RRRRDRSPAQWHRLSDPGSERSNRARAVEKNRAVNAGAAARDLATACARRRATSPGCGSRSGAGARLALVERVTDLPAGPLGFRASGARTGLLPAKRNQGLTRFYAGLYMSVVYNRKRRRVGAEADEEVFGGHEGAGNRDGEIS